MSMNIYIQATRQIQVVKTGRIEEQNRTFSAYQTPTRVTYDILRSAEPAAAYVAWVMSCSADYTEDLFEEDDLFEDGPAVGSKICNDGANHVLQFEAWMTMCREEGFDVQFELI